MPIIKTADKYVCDRCGGEAKLDGEWWRLEHVDGGPMLTIRKPDGPIQDVRSPLIFCSDGCLVAYVATVKIGAGKPIPPGAVGNAGASGGSPRDITWLTS